MAQDIGFSEPEGYDLPPTRPEYHPFEIYPSQVTPTIEEELSYKDLLEWTMQYADTQLSYSNLIPQHSVSGMRPPPDTSWVTFETFGRKRKFYKPQRDTIRN